MSNTHHKSKKHNRLTSFWTYLLKETTYGVMGLIILFVAFILFWIATLTLPDFTNFENRKISNSTKIYDRTGQIVLYNIHENIRRTAVPLDKISPNIRNATVAIEDAQFYQHHGISVRGILRALWSAASTQSLAGGGGSTITQQVIKNALLTREKTLSRKLKEWVLAIKMDAEVSKDDILNIYLNESPYGGNIYGVEEASLSYFGKHASEVNLAEAAYLAALPQRPSYFSPYGPNREDLESRKNLVLKRMYELGYISKEEKDAATSNVVSFKPLNESSGKALHFVFYLRAYLEDKYGKDLVENGGLKIISTLDADLQAKLEKVVYDGAMINKDKWKATNSGLIAIQPSSGQILAMVGSRDFFDKEIPGQFNITTAKRQPGSTFKPIVYASAFEKGYTPNTVLFDVPTQFSARCDWKGTPLGNATEQDCYMPENYDGNFRGPVSLREALAQSLNIPAVKVLYLTGINNALTTAKDLGITSLGNANQYGLSLVLGGGETTLLEMTDAYATFANDGYYNEPASILKIIDRDGVVLEEFKDNPKQVISKSTTNKINSILTDNNARTPAYGFNNALYFPDYDVAAKTGTTNDYKDVWVIGYTKGIAIGMWAGNNDNTPIEKKTSGTVLAPIWNKAMTAAIDESEDYRGTLSKDGANDKTGLPYLDGVWCDASGVKSILAYVTRGSPLTPPSNPYQDSQYELWNTAIQNYISTYTSGCPYVINHNKSTTTESLDNTNTDNTNSVTVPSLPVNEDTLPPTTTPILQYRPNLN